MERNDLFSIGDMARMFHLSVGSLRHYEAMGLVTPEYVDPDTGYRYYSARQFEPLNTIRYLRALDMPLPQIAAFLQNKEVDVIEEMLRRQKQTVAQKQQQLAVIQQQLLPGLYALHQRSRAGDALRAQTHRLPGGQGQRLRQTADAQLRPLQVDEQLFYPGFAQQRQPVLVRCQRPVRKIHADAGHAGLHHLLQKLYIGTGRADGSVKIHNSSCNSRFLSIVA